MKMVRKQVYITEDQDQRLKRLAVERGLTEAQIIRTALDQLTEITYGQRAASTAGRIREVAVMDRYTADNEKSAAAVYSAQGQRLDDEAWEEELAFMRSIGAAKQGTGTGEAAWRFNRDEVYEERLAKILRRH